LYNAGALVLARFFKPYLHYKKTGKLQLQLPLFYI